MEKRMKKAFVASVLVLSSVVAFSQGKGEETSKDVIKIRIEKEKDGKKTIEERVIDASKMTEGERQIRFERIMDTLSVPNGNKKMKVIVSGKDAKGFDNLNESVFFESEGNFEEEGNPTSKKSRVYTFRMDGETLGAKMREMGDEIPRRFEMFTPNFRWDNQLFREWEKTPFKGIDVFPNKPSTDVLNVRFVAESEGDVSIKLIDLQGKTVAEESVKKHKGEFVGQIKLKKNTKGIHFVLLTQGDDGVVRRVSL